MTHATDARPHTTRTLLILGAAALAFLAQTTLIPALPELARALGTDEAGVTWTLTAYLVAAAVCTPLVGRLGDIYGKRRPLVVAPPGSSTISTSWWCPSCSTEAYGSGTTNCRGSRPTTTSRPHPRPAVSRMSRSIRVERRAHD